MRLARPISVLPQIPHRLLICNPPPRRVSLTRPFLRSTNLVYTPTSYVHTLSHSFRMPSASPSPKGKVLVLGAGNFGSCLADHLGDSNHEVFMWSREKSVVDYFNEHHKNPQYLKDHYFPRTVCAVGPDLPDVEFVKRMDVLLFAIPTQGLRYSFSRVHLSSVNTTLPRALLTRLRPNLDEAHLPLLIFVNKGIETDTNALTLEIIADTCGKDIARVSTFLVSRTPAWSPKFYL
jgi:hypothetical protein